MKSTRLIISLVAAAGLAACSGSPKDAAGPQQPQPADPAAPASEQHAGHEHGHGEHGHGEHGEAHHPELPPAVDTFHDVLAPLWHADKGQARTDNTCKAVPELDSKARAIQAEAVPAKLAANEPAWRKASADLVASIATLQTECARAGRPNFETTFSSVHDAFHALMDLLHRA